MGNNIQQHLVKKLNVGPASISLITNKVSFCQIFFSNERVVILT